MGQWNYQMRVALPFGTLVLALFSLAVADRFSRVPRAVMMAAGAVYLLLMFLGERTDTRRRAAGRRGVARERGVHGSHGGPCR